MNRRVTRPGVRYAIIACLYLVLCAPTNARAGTAAQIDRIVREEMAEQAIVGAAIGIVRNGRIQFARGYGYKDLQRRMPVTDRTVFRWGSVSKTLTAVAALRLAELDPGFSLDDRVTEHVHYWPGYGHKRDIRIRDLLSHRAGIIHYRKKKRCPGNKKPRYDRYRHTSKYYNARQAVDVFAQQPLCFPPGSAFKYSTFGYSLLGAAIEGGSGTSYANWVYETIGRPLSMYSLRQATGNSLGFDRHCHGLREIVSGNAAWKLPGGGWESSIIDLAKFANGLLQGELLDDTPRLWAGVAHNPNYGYGIKYSPDKQRVWHEGKADNGRTLLYLYPQSADRLGIVILTNSLHGKPKRIARRLASLFGHHHYPDTAPAIDPCPRMPGAATYSSAR